MSKNRNHDKKQQELPRKFKALIIPREIWLDGNLSIQEKAFLAEIDSLDHDDKGCYASNSYFAKFFHISIRQAQRVIGKLAEKKLLKIEVNQAKGNTRILSLLTTETSLPPHDKSVVTPSRQKCRDPLTTETSLPYDKSVVTPHDILGAHNKEYRTIPIPIGIGEIKIKTTAKELGIDNLSEKGLGLGLEIAKKRMWFCGELGKIFSMTENEAVTFARIARHLEEMVRTGGVGAGVFTEAIGWAKEARASTAINKKGLFVKKVKQETGFAAQSRMLRKI